MKNILSLSKVLFIYFILFVSTMSCNLIGGKIGDKPEYVGTWKWGTERLVITEESISEYYFIDNRCFSLNWSDQIVRVTSDEIITDSGSYTYSVNDDELIWYAWKYERIKDDVNKNLCGPE